MGSDPFSIGRVRPRGRCSDTRNYKRSMRAAVEARRFGKERRAPIGPENDAVTISLPLPPSLAFARTLPSPRFALIKVGDGEAVNNVGDRPISTDLPKRTLLMVELGLQRR